MALSASQQDYPLPGQKCRISWAGSSGDYFRIIAVDAPAGSRLQKSIESEGRYVAAEGSSKDKTWEFTPDLGGVYFFSLEDLQKSDAGKRFADDVAQESSLSLIEALQFSVFVGEKVEIQMGVSPDTATLLMYCFDSTIRKTTVPVHGIESPAFVNHKSAIARSCAENSSVVEALTAITDQSASTAIGTFRDMFDAAREAYQAHYGDTDVHPDNDTINVVPDSWQAITVSSSKDAVNKLWLALKAHAATKNQVIGETTDNIHSNEDGRSSYITPGASQDRLSHFWALADFMERLVEHAAIGSPVHVTSSTVTFSTVSPLMTIFRAWVVAAKTASSSAARPQTINRGAFLLERMAGGKRTP